jgi:hypothetical protein
VLNLASITALSTLALRDSLLSFLNRPISSSSRAKSLTALIPIMASCMTLAMAPSLVLTTRIRCTSAFL